MLHIDHLTLYLPVTNNYTYTKPKHYYITGSTGTHIENKNDRYAHTNTLEVIKIYMAP